MNARVKGWCPSAYRPMETGDGLIVRVKPYLGHLEAAQVLGVCALAAQFGNGILDLTSRANLQIRGVKDHGAVLEGLGALDLLDADPDLDAHRNILIEPFWTPGDLSARLGRALLQILPALQDLPAKMGFAIDTGRGAHLHDASADFRFELSDAGLILRAEGAAKGRRVTEESAMQALSEMVAWFVDTGGPQVGRMGRHLKTCALPADWLNEAPRPCVGLPVPGPAIGGQIVGTPFGKMRATDLSRLIEDSAAQAIRLMHGRLFQLREGQRIEAPAFVTSPKDSRLRVHACPGAPFCAEASVDTRTPASALSRPGLETVIHVSGCEKGCAHPKAAPLTLVGREGRFDLVRHGAPWDEPERCGLSPAQLQELA